MYEYYHYHDDDEFRDLNMDMLNANDGNNLFSQKFPIFPGGGGGLGGFGPGGPGGFGPPPFGPGGPGGFGPGGPGGFGPPPFGPGGFGPPPFGPGGQQGSFGPPKSPPPSLVPKKTSKGVNIFNIDAGSIRPCLFRYVYLWLDSGEQFWCWLIFVGRRSAAGWRWTGFRWIYFGVDLRDINSFVCY